MQCLLLQAYLAVEMPAHRLSKEVMIALRLQLVEGLVLLEGGCLQCQARTPLQLTTILRSSHWPEEWQAMAYH